MEDNMKSKTALAVSIRDRVNKVTYKFDSKIEAYNAGFKLARELNASQNIMSVRNDQYHAYFKGHGADSVKNIGKDKRGQK